MKKIKNISNSGFKAPEGYFEQLEDSVMARLKTESVRDISEEHGFKAPEGYFDEVEQQILEKLSIDNETKVVSIFSRKSLYYVSGIAAAIVILLAVFLNGSAEENEELDYQMVETYIIDQDISTYEIASLLTEDELDQIELDIMSSNLTDEESLEDYLLENINLEDIIEQ
ncbi:MAG: hypothetical protein HKO67_12025 [Flavobacteriaceae bacterium]|nr:hypothetical protein [Bacteroidia bacterium]NNF81512.1 hypothetical protein [Flavobacteriaceae bacterium]NNL81207.1 hypothetical protein [Flavobacteriaceae bacterium]